MSNEPQEHIEEGIGGVPKHPHHSEIIRLKHFSDDINTAISNILKCYKYCDHEYDDIHLIPKDEIRGIILGQLKSSLKILKGILGDVSDYKNYLLNDFPEPEYEKE